jgi:6-phosphogluconolactonase (cycloisomerase 2 family)
MSSSISMFIVDNQTGGLAQNGEVAAGVDPSWVTVDPSNKYAYVTNIAGTTVSQYTIGGDGKLTAMTPATVAAGTRPSVVAVHPSGSYAYVANLGNSVAPSNVSQYRIESNGALTAMNPSSVAAGISPVSIAVDPSGRYAYVANTGDVISPTPVAGNVSQYTIGSTGALTPMTPATVSNAVRPLFITVQPSGNYDYVADYDNSRVYQYTVASNGALAAMTPDFIGSGLGPGSIAVTPSGTHAYVACGSNRISQYRVGTDGKLTTLAADIAPTGLTNPTSIIVDQFGTYVYMVNYGDFSAGSTAARMSIDSTGILRSIVHTATELRPSSIYITRGM